jgi:predicted nucleic acid-binding protein
MQKYGDRQIDLADATLIHLATELNSPDILTLDRDFAFYRWGRNNPFRLLIGLDD